MSSSIKSSSSKLWKKERVAVVESESESIGESIGVIAEKMGITNLSPQVFPSLAADVEYRVREMMQEAIKCMRHCNRTHLSCHDVDSALHLRNVEPIYFGFRSPKFKRHKDLFYLHDKDLDLKHVIEEAPLSNTTPDDTAILPHWLAIEGVQPAYAPSQGLIFSSHNNNKPDEYKQDDVDIKSPPKHILSRELQLYFEKITQLSLARSDSILFKEALFSLANDSGLHHLVPYFTYFIADEVTLNLKNVHILFALMRLIGSLLQNPHLLVEPYLHQLIPSIMTCIIAKKLGNNCSDNHWELRNFSANLVSLICKRYSHAYDTIQPRMTKTFLHTFLDPMKTLPQHYGAIRALVELGPSVVRLIVVPNLEMYLQLIEPEMQLESPKNQLRRLEAWRVYDVLLRAVGQCVYSQLKLLPSLRSLPSQFPWKSNSKLLTTITNKRKTGMVSMMLQPPLKRVATEGTISVNSLPTNIQRASTLDVTPPSMSRQLTNENISGGIGRNEAQVKRTTSTASNQIWTDIMTAGQLLPVFAETFGDSLHLFVPSPLSSVFI